MSSGGDFARLLAPGQIGGMTLKNRIVMPPMATNFGTAEGYVTQRSLDYYAARARGGVGLIIVEFTCVDAPEGRGAEHQLAIDDDRFIPGLADLARTIKDNGARAAIQIHHAGRQTRSSVTGMQPVAPSPVAAWDREVPRPLTPGEIAKLVIAFADAAVRAKRAGFDGVELHGAHGYLIAQFLSAASNRRRDRYGGSLKNRARFLLEIIEAVRGEVGRDYPLWCRINGGESGMEKGLTIEEATQFAIMAQDAGVDAIHVSGFASGPRRAPPMAQRPGTFLPFAEAVKQAVSIPVIAVSRLDAALAETALQKRQADFAAFGRPLLVDPDLPNKVASGRLEDIKPCIYCANCLDSIWSGPGGITCTVNPALGREREFAVSLAAKSKRVFVFGGGPAGMEASRIAATRGHRVELFEQAPELGGQLLLAQVPRNKQTIGDILRYLRVQMARAGVEAHVGTAGSVELIATEAPDAVVLATGASPLIPDIPGIRRPNVVLAEDVLRGAATVGESVAVIGGELVACEVADLLAEAGKKVTLMRRGAELALKVNPAIREAILYRLSNNPRITMLTEVQYRSIRDAGVVVQDKDGQERTIAADTVVLAAGSRPNAALLDALKDTVREVYAVGDCVEPRNILEAMKEGYRAGLAI